MKHTIQPAQISFNQHGMPVSTEFDDIYFSNQDGAAESRYVFLTGNQLPERFKAWSNEAPFVIAETGFGSGLNMLQAANQFIQFAPAHAQLHLVSFERYPMQAEQIQQVLSHWPELRELSESLCRQYPPLVPGIHRVQLTRQITLDLYFSDVLSALPGWAEANPGCVNAWFLDGFAPSKNPDMWQPKLYQAMHKSAASTCTVATFTAVGAVRRGLIEAGFAMRKTPGFGSKREMLVGHSCRLEAPALGNPFLHVVVIGGGIAGASIARTLAHRFEQNGYKKEQAKVTVLCADKELAMGASGNAQGALYPLLQADQTPTTQFYTQAFIFARQFYQRFVSEAVHWSGVLQLGFSDKARLRQKQIMQRTHYPEDFVKAVNSEEVSQLSGLPLSYSGLFYPCAGWVEPVKAVTHLLSHRAIHTYLSTKVTSINKIEEGWQVNTNNQCFTANHVIWATGAHLKTSAESQIEIRPAGGQVSYVQANAASANLRTVLCHKGYITPAHNNRHCVGATFTKLDQAFLATYNQETDSRSTDNEENLKINFIHTQSNFAASAICGERRSVRATTPDHLPVVGKHPDYSGGVWILGGLGARGFTSAPWCAELLADRILKAVCCSDKKIIDATITTRFQKRSKARQAIPART